MLVVWWIIGSDSEPVLSWTKWWCIIMVIYMIMLQKELRGHCSLSGGTSYCHISWSLEAVRLYVKMIASLYNLTVLPRCLSNCRAIGKVGSRNSRLRDFTRSCGKTSLRLVNRDSVYSLGLLQCRGELSLPKRILKFRYLVCPEHLFQLSNRSENLHRTR